MEKVVQIIVRQIARKLGDQIEVVILYGSLPQGQYEPSQSDINLLVVVSDGTSVHALRSLFLPIWEEYGHILRRAPLIAQKSDFIRYIQIAPTFAHHLIHEGQILFGPPDYFDEWPETNPFDATAHLAWEVMKASSALTPEMFSPENAQHKQVQLRRLARRLHGKPISKEKTAVELFSLVQYHLNHKISLLKGNAPAVHPAKSKANGLPGLQSTYKLSEQMVLVFQNLTPQRIMGIQWPVLADRLGNRSKGLQITTADQLCLIVETERPLDLVFLRYQHEWGENLLTDIKLSKRQILRHAARLPLVVQIDLLPNAYLTQDDSKLRDIVHDFQNKLLNVQLEHELLCRLQNIERFVPPEPLPDRSTPSPIRIDAIFKQLGWWAEYYANEMTKYD